MRLQQRQTTMDKIIYIIREFFTKENVVFYPYPCDDFWVTSDGNRFYKHQTAVDYSKKHTLSRVEIKTWNETTQEWVYSKTFY